MKGKIHKLVQTGLNTVRIHYSGGDLSVCQLSQEQINRLTSAMSGEGLLFRTTDSPLRRNSWVHFLLPEEGTDGVALITGSRLDERTSNIFNGDCFDISRVR